MELLANVRRLTGIVLDRLEQGSREGTLDQGQVRMLGSIALRSLRLWQEALRKNGPGEHGQRELLEAQTPLTQKPTASERKDSTEKGEQN